MIKQILLSTILFASLTTQAQDTLYTSPDAYGFHHVHLKDGDDTISHTYYPNNSLESVKKYKNGLVTHNTRYHVNGNIMWTQEFSNGSVNGEMKLYGMKGRHFATFQMTNDTITDTLFNNDNYRFAFGRYTYYSIVHGGMRRPDGQSNTRGGHGIGRLMKFYTVKHDLSKEKQQIHSEFYTDTNGFFFTELSSGNFGIFPWHYKIEDVKPNMGTPGQASSMSTMAHWNIQDPIDMKSKNFCYLLLNYHSVGVAP